MPTKEQIYKLQHVHTIDKYTTKRKKRIAASHNTMAGSHRHKEWKKPDTKEYISFDPIHMTFNPRNPWWCKEQWFPLGRRYGLERDLRELGMFSVLI